MEILCTKLMFRFLIASATSRRPKYNWQSDTISFELVLKNHTLLGHPVCVRVRVCVQAVIMAYLGRIITGKLLAHHAPTDRPRAIALRRKQFSRQNKLRRKGSFAAWRECRGCRITGGYWTYRVITSNAAEISLRDCMSARLLESDTVMYNRGKTA